MRHSHPIHPSLLPQADASTLVDRAELERQVQACIAGAIPTTAYLGALAGAGFEISSTRRNDYRFITPRALEACSTYGVESMSIAATRD